MYVGGLTAPVSFVQDPLDSNVQFVVQKGGLVRVIRNGVLELTPFLDLTAQISTGGERGLLRMAVHPVSGRAFVNFTNTEGARSSRGSRARWIRSWPMSAPGST